MKNNQSKQEFILAATLVVIGIGSRLLFNALGIWNFNAVMASSVFAGAYLLRSRRSYLIPIVTMLATDAVLGFYFLPAMIINYGALMLCMFIGSSYSKRPSLGRWVGVTLGSSVAFFIITNFGTWLFQTMEPQLYAMNLSGLAQAYAMAIPFYRNSLASDVIFSAVLFGGFEMAKVFIPKGKVAVV
jgi:hypothetical protein